MPYRANPFLERMSERTTSDQTFVNLFSPKILERLEQDAFDGAVHIFRSPPGGGKTTLLRAFTPTALHAFWNAGRSNDTNEAYRALIAREILHDKEGPQLLGVLLSCASGYADLPLGATEAQDGLFRALLDCRIVLRSLRSLLLFASHTTRIQLSDITLEYDDGARDLKLIPRLSSASDLELWAEQRERSLYAQLDSVTRTSQNDMPSHLRYEGILWMQSVRFLSGTREIGKKRLLMIDDLHKLRKKQRGLLVQEVTDLRPRIPVWLAERTIALGDRLLAQGAREGREVREYSLDEIWSEVKGRHQFFTFAQNILDRRLDVQDLLPEGTSFSQYLRTQLQPDEFQHNLEKAHTMFQKEIVSRQSNPRYAEWIARAKACLTIGDLESIREVYVTRILLVRDENKRQMTLEFAPLPTSELEQRDSSQVQAAAEIFMNEELGIPYYFGMERLCALATFNVEELLSLAAALYDALLAKQMLRKQALLLSPGEQEKLIREVARRRRDFIPKNHTEGARAQHLLDAIGEFCRERTFLPNAPYAPGVTGIRLSTSEITALALDQQSPLRLSMQVLRRVLAECVAENLLIVRESSQSTARESGTIFYLNRMLCANYGLPLQMGGWQDVDVARLAEWMERGAPPRRQPNLQIG
jgi:hypothetical protein